MFIFILMNTVADTITDTMAELTTSESQRVTLDASWKVLQFKRTVYACSIYKCVRVCACVCVCVCV